MDFESLVNKIQSANFHLQQNAIKAVNIHLTIRNWIIGFYIVEFEQYGEDRAEYGSQLLELLAKKIKVRGLSETNLKICRQFYKVYYQFRVLLNKKIDILIPIQIRQTVTDEFRTFDMEKDSIRQTASDELKETTKRQKDIDYLYQLLGSTSYSHFIELSKIEDDVKRNFYELLILKTTPSLKELQRQINTLTFERLGLTGNYQSSFEQVKLKIKPEQSSDIVKSHYFFEFLEINYPQLIEESELEQALINHLQQFIIELGNGFCFEARQKRVLIGDEYFFIDLVFYHRITAIRFARPPSVSTSP